MLRSVRGTLARPRSTAATIVLSAVSLVMLVLSTSAVASTQFTATPARPIGLTSIGKLTFELEGTNYECNFTLNGRLREAAVRIAGGTMGEINETRIRECVGSGEIERSLLETPWTIASTRAIQGGGTLPENYTGLLFTIRAIKIRWSIFFGIARCLYEGDIGVLVPLTRTGRGAYTTGNGRALEQEPYRVIQVGEAFGCPPEGSTRAEFRLTQQTITFR